jgi:hypothetical protein
MAPFSNHKQVVFIMCLALLVLTIPVAASSGRSSGGSKCNPLTQKCNDNGHDTDTDDNDQGHNCTVGFNIGATGTSLGASCSESSVPKSVAEVLTWPASFGVAVVLTAAGLVL